MTTTENADQAGRLLRWARKVRTLQEERRRLSNSDSVLQTWLTRPVAELVTFAAMFVLTCLAGVLCPRGLHVAETPRRNRDEVHKPLFLDYRALLLTLVALAEILAGVSLMEDELQYIEEPALEFLVTQVAVVAVLFVWLASGAASVWLGARSVALPLTFGRTMKIVGYAMGTVWLIVPVSVAVGWGLVVGLEQLEAPDPVLFISVALAAVGVLVSVVHVTFIVPMATYHPNAARRKLWLGWFMGYVCTAGVMVILLVGLVAILGLAGALDLN